MPQLLFHKIEQDKAPAPNHPCLISAIFSILPEIVSSPVHIQDVTLNPELQVVAPLIIISLRIPVAETPVQFPFGP